MKIEEICEYLNELGILDINTTPVFLSLYSGFKINNKKYKLSKNAEDNTFKIILFAYLKRVISNDKALYEICSNIISLYNKNKIIRLYQGICFLKKVLFYQIKSKLNHFLFLLFKKKYPKRKYFPYNPIKGAKANENKNQRYFNNTNRRRRPNNYNNTDDYSLSYISMRNNAKDHNLLLNNMENMYTQPVIENNQFNLSNMNNNELIRSKKNNSAKKKKFIGITEKMNMKKKELSLNNMKKKNI
jgi:hypothetical protein